MYVIYEAAEGDPVTVESSGLLVSTEFPNLAASTDGFVTSANSGKGVLEIKCPVGKKSILHLATTRKNFCLKRSVDGSLHLQKSHIYFTQIQFDMAISKCLQCDFIVFTELEAAADDEQDNEDDIGHDIFH